MIEGAKKFFLPGHQTDFFFWTDMPELQEKAFLKNILDALIAYPISWVIAAGTG